ncbi:MAG: gamma-glutamyl-gamma-aminobutyrate hydrolase family protein [Tissierellia bacterium]|nr:gamma-glutamyl-gamma-aminobutyrate hydrolase family protein [Tissierellia bacterium]
MKVIGLSSQQRIAENHIRYAEIIGYYIESIEAIGALPFIIPIVDDVSLAKEYIKRIDMLVLTGGDDVHPRWYGQNPMHNCTEIDYKRDLTDMALLKAAIDEGVPVLGICRGLQIINSYLGGTLIQDIPTQADRAYGHRSWDTYTTGHHEIELMKDSFLHKIFGKDKLMVNSIHHQAIKIVAPGMKTSAKSFDGIIEAFENEEKKLYGVQFHPEGMKFYEDKALDIFKYVLAKS